MRKFLFLLGLLHFHPLSSQIVLNEISSSCDTSVVLDDNGKAKDWIEIYNASASPVNLSGLFLTDDILILNKWPMPAISVAAGTGQLIFASGENRVNGSYLHTNFRLDREGETVMLTDGISIIDSFNIGNLDLNQSRGRKPDGDPSLSYFVTATPGSTNNNSTNYATRSIEPYFTVNRGFYGTTQTVFIGSTDPIRYTTDGSIPTVFSPVYSGVILVNPTTVLRARTFGILKLPSPTITHTYFINETGLGELPVISISIDAADFNDVYDNTQYWNDYYPEHRAHLEYFAPSDSFEFETDFDLRLHGTTSTQLWPQKGLRVNCRPYYLHPEIRTALFPADKPSVDVFEGMNLRHDYQGGGMWNAYATNVSKGMDIDQLALRPAIVFVNGLYWGEYHMNEKGDGDYIEENHPGVDADSIDVLVQKYNWTNGYNGITIQEGSDTAFFNHIHVLDSLLPNTTDYYYYFVDRFDWKSFYDYLVAEIYVGNTDWMGHNGAAFNNVKLWRDQRPGGKWRYIQYDCDYSIGIQTPTEDVFPELLSPGPLGYHGQIFSKSLQTTYFRDYFVNRFADMLNTRYQPIEANPVVTAYHDTLAPVMTRHLVRWGTSTYTDWENALNTYMTGNAGPRVTQLRNQIESNFGLVKQVQVTFEIYPSQAAGSVLLNTINPQNYPWTGTYFDGVPINIEPSANAGWQFDHWESPSLGANNTTDSLNWNVTYSQTVKLYFEPGVGNDKPKTFGFTTLYPNPSGEIAWLRFNSSSLPEKITLHDAVGNFVKEISLSSIGGEIYEMKENLPAGFYLVEVDWSVDGVEVLKWIKE